jgi:hypothetical protein
MNQDFYVGYVPKMPPELGKWIARIVAGLVVAGLGIGAILIFDQPRFANSNFEYGIVHEYSGLIEEWPYPILRTSDSSFLLVATGKHGLSEQVKGLQGKSVALRGTLIERGRDRMLEVVPETLRTIASVADPKTDEPRALGTVTLRGEIVDSKCYLGVMNPGNSKVHRDCAARCISGGAPPAFVAYDATGEARVLLLVGADGRQVNREVLSFVAEPLEITGELVRAGSNLILKAEPAQFRRIPE